MLILHPHQSGRQEANAPFAEVHPRGFSNGQVATAQLPFTSTLNHGCTL